MLKRKGRSRLITFRLTDTEHEHLKNRCDQIGESMSNFARVTVLRYTSAGNSNLNGDLTTIGLHLRELKSTLLELSDQIERTLGSEDSPSPRDHRDKTPR
jgi:hypothetical protein